MGHGCVYVCVGGGGGEGWKGGGGAASSKSIKQSCTQV